MSLSSWEQQALDSISDGLASSDPELVALLTTFTRLASAQDMPVGERIGAGSLRAIRSSRWQRRHPRRDRHRLADRLYQPVGPVALLLWLLAAVMLILVALALNLGSNKRACTTFLVGACTESAPAHSSSRSSHGAVTSLAPRQSAVPHPATGRR